MNPKKGRKSKNKRYRRDVPEKTKKQRIKI